MQMLTSPSPSPSSSSSSSDSTADVSTTAEDASEDEERGLERERVRVHEGILLERDGDEEARRISSRASPSIIESKGPSVSSSASLGTSTGAAGTLTGEGGSSRSPSPSPKPKPKVEPGKMDPLLSLYYTAPICALMNGVLAWRAEVVPFLQGQGQNQEQGQGQGQSQAQGQDESCAGLLGIVLQTGLGLLLLNACVGFMLNVAVFTLVRIIPLLVFFSTYRLRHTK